MITIIVLLTATATVYERLANFEVKINMSAAPEKKIEKNYTSSQNNSIM